MTLNSVHMQHTKFVVDFAAGQVDFILLLPDWQVSVWVKFFEEINLINPTSKNSFQDS